MKARDIYLRSAEEAEKHGVGACVAIHRHTGHRFPWDRDHPYAGLSREALKFQELFCPLPEEYYFDSWLHEAAAQGLIDEEEFTEWRVLALCFMAAMVGK